MRIAKISLTFFFTLFFGLGLFAQSNKAACPDCQAEIKQDTCGLTVHDYGSNTFYQLSSLLSYNQSTGVATLATASGGTYDLQYNKVNPPYTSKTLFRNYIQGDVNWCCCEGGGGEISPIDTLNITGTVVIENDTFYTISLDTQIVCIKQTQFDSLYGGLVDITDSISHYGQLDTAYLGSIATVVEDFSFLECGTLNCRWEISIPTDIGNRWLCFFNYGPGGVNTISPPSGILYTAASAIETWLNSTGVGTFQVTSSDGMLTIVELTGVEAFSITFKAQSDCGGTIINNAPFGEVCDQSQALLVSLCEDSLKVEGIAQLIDSLSILISATNENTDSISAINETLLGVITDCDGEDAVRVDLCNDSITIRNPIDSIGVTILNPDSIYTPIVEAIGNISDSTAISNLPLVECGDCVITDTLGLIADSRGCTPATFVSITMSSGTYLINETLSGITPSVSEWEDRVNDALNALGVGWFVFDYDPGCAPIMSWYGCWIVSYSGNETPVSFEMNHICGGTFTQSFDNAPDCSGQIAAVNVKLCEPLRIDGVVDVNLTNDSLAISNFPAFPDTLMVMEVKPDTTCGVIAVDYWCGVLGGDPSDCVEDTGTEVFNGSECVTTYAFIAEQANSGVSTYDIQASPGTGETMIASIDACIQSGGIAQLNTLVGSTIIGSVSLGGLYMTGYTYDGTGTITIGMDYTANGACEGIQAMYDARTSYANTSKICNATVVCFNVGATGGETAGYKYKSLTDCKGDQFWVELITNDTTATLPSDAVPCGGGGTELGESCDTPVHVEVCPTPIYTTESSEFCTADSVYILTVTIELPDGYVFNTSLINAESGYSPPRYPDDLEPCTDIISEQECFELINSIAGLGGAGNEINIINVFDASITPIGQICYNVTAGNLQIQCAALDFAKDLRPCNALDSIIIANDTSRISTIKCQYEAITDNYIQQLTQVIETAAGYTNIRYFEADGTEITLSGFSFVRDCEAEDVEMISICVNGSDNATMTVTYKPSGNDTLFTIAGTIITPTDWKEGECKVDLIVNNGYVLECDTAASSLYFAQAANFSDAATAQITFVSPKNATAIAAIIERAQAVEVEQAKTGVPIANVVITSPSGGIYEFPPSSFLGRAGTVLSFDAGSVVTWPGPESGDILGVISWVEFTRCNCNPVEMVQRVDGDTVLYLVKVLRTNEYDPVTFEKTEIVLPFEFGIVGPYIGPCGQENSKEVLGSRELCCNEDLVTGSPDIAAKRLVWIDGADIANMYNGGTPIAGNSGDLVDEVRDKIAPGVAPSAVVPTGDGAPTLQTSAVNGNSVLDFDGIDDRLIVNLGATGAGAPFTLEYLVSTTDMTTSQACILAVGPTTGGNYTGTQTWQISRDGLGAEFILRLGDPFLSLPIGQASNGGASSSEVVLGDWASFADGQQHLITINYDGTFVYGYYDGQLQFQVEPSTPLLGEYFRLFGNRAGNAYLQGSLAEMYLSDGTLTDIEIGTLNAYMICKWGIDPAAAAGGAGDLTLGEAGIYTGFSPFSETTYTDGSKEYVNSNTGQRYPVPPVPGLAYCVDEAGTEIPQPLLVEIQKDTLPCLNSCTVTVDVTPAPYSTVRIGDINSSVGVLFPGGTLISATSGLGFKIIAEAALNTAPIDGTFTVESTPGSTLESFSITYEGTEVLTDFIWEFNGSGLTPDVFSCLFDEPVDGTTIGLPVIIQQCEPLVVTIDGGAGGTSPTNAPISYEICAKGDSTILVKEFYSDNLLTNVEYWYGNIQLLTAPTEYSIGVCGGSLDSCFNNTEYNGEAISSQYQNFLVELITSQTPCDPSATNPAVSQSYLQDGIWWQFPEDPVISGVPCDNLIFEYRWRFRNMPEFNCDSVEITKISFELKADIKASLASFPIVVAPAIGGVLQPFDGGLLYKFINDADITSDGIYTFTIDNPYTLLQLQNENLGFIMGWRRGSYFDMDYVKMNVEYIENCNTEAQTVQVCNNIVTKEKNSGKIADILTQIYNNPDGCIINSINTLYEIAPGMSLTFPANSLYSYSIAVIEGTVTEQHGTTGAVVSLPEGYSGGHEARGNCNTLQEQIAIIAPIGARAIIRAIQAQ